LTAAGIAMGTRFLLTQDSPVPAAVKDVYRSKGVTDTLVTTQVDGVPHRVLRTDFTERLHRAGPVLGLPRAVRNAARFQRLSGLRWRDLLREGRTMRRSQALTWSQVLMAANTPILLKAAMVDGRPDLGVMSSGQVVGLLDDLPTVAELVARILEEAETVLKRLGA
jgi:NAD(P)H-dependent flavin oxidoreductase YrpB (nitropropane dioxygenase family)